MEAAAQQIIIHGTILADSETDTLIGAVVYLKGTSLAVVSDRRGKYSLDISNYIDTIQQAIVVYEYIGYNSLEVPIDQNARGSLHISVQLLESDLTLSFYVSKPNFWQRMKWTIKRWFSRKD